MKLIFKMMLSQSVVLCLFLSCCDTADGATAFVPSLLTTSTSVQTRTGGAQGNRVVVVPLVPPLAMKEEPQNEVTTTTKRLDRRTLLRQLTAVAAGTSTVTVGTLLPGQLQEAWADPSTLSILQSPLQDSLAPGNWIGQFLGLNARTVTWTFQDVPPAVVSQALVETLKALSLERKAKLYMPNYEITTATPNQVHVRTWTKNEWLDSLDVKLQSTADGGTMATANFYATGFLPTSFPAAPIVNVALFWIPFGSNGPREMLQDFRLRAIEGLLRKQLAATTGTTSTSSTATGP